MQKRRIFANTVIVCTLPDPHTALPDPEFPLSYYCMYTMVPGYRYMFCAEEPRSTETCKERRFAIHTPPPSKTYTPSPDVPPLDARRDGVLQTCRLHLILKPPISIPAYPPPFWISCCVWKCAVNWLWLLNRIKYEALRENLEMLYRTSMADLQTHKLTMEGATRARIEVRFRAYSSACVCVFSSNLFWTPV